MTIATSDRRRVHDFVKGGLVVTLGTRDCERLFDRHCVLIVNRMTAQTRSTFCIFRVLDVELRVTTCALLCLGARLVRFVALRALGVLVSRQYRFRSMAGLTILHFGSDKRVRRMARATRAVPSVKERSRLHPRGDRHGVFRVARDAETLCESRRPVVRVTGHAGVRRQRFFTFAVRSDHVVTQAAICRLRKWLLVGPMAAITPHLMNADLRRQMMRVRSSHCRTTRRATIGLFEMATTTAPTIDGLRRILGAKDVAAKTRHGDAAVQRVMLCLLLAMTLGAGLDSLGMKAGIGNRMAIVAGELIFPSQRQVLSMPWSRAGIAEATRNLQLASIGPCRQKILEAAASGDNQEQPWSDSHHGLRLDAPPASAATEIANSKPAKTPSP